MTPRLVCYLALASYASFWSSKVTDLKYPAEYAMIPESKKVQICNGCGPKGWKGELVPDQLLGVSIAEACNIHDFQFHVGGDELDRKYADDVFKTNMYALINRAAGPRHKLYARKVMAWWYWWTVRRLGKPHFTYR